MTKKETVKKAHRPETKIKMVRLWTLLAFALSLSQSTEPNLMRWINKFLMGFHLAVYCWCAHNLLFSSLCCHSFGRFIDMNAAYPEEAAHSINAVIATSFSIRWMNFRNNYELICTFIAAVCCVMAMRIRDVINRNACLWLLVVGIAADAGASDANAAALFSTCILPANGIFSLECSRWLLFGRISWRSIVFPSIYEIKRKFDYS